MPADPEDRRGLKHIPVSDLLRMLGGEAEPLRSLLAAALARAFEGTFFTTYALAVKRIRMLAARTLPFYKRREDLEAELRRFLPDQIS